MLKCTKLGKLGTFDDKTECTAWPASCFSGQQGQFIPLTIQLFNCNM